MARKTFSSKTVAAAFLGGALFFSGISYAATSTHLEVSLDRLNFFIEGQDKTSADGKFDNGSSKVPESIVYDGTTYIPLRMAANMIGQPIFWDGLSRSISMGNPYVVLYDAKGNRIGHAVLSPINGAVKMTLSVSNLTPGKHGIHIHEKAFGGFDFKTAGGHFNPENKKHGHANPEGHHVGDIENLDVGENGKAELTYDIEGASLDPNSKYSILGRSIIIHAKEDDGKTDPSGDSGDRIAGGIIPQ
ncbi:superoxide dismutase family protein [Paenibacillus sedimenti]|uniref:Superoxide dismutase family protein n=1 Tax=Paenibacillus sedimenti TaxID=2770274 RepID=A0A926QL28_9BACL|nr:superoxide dismutase family protein [Paenibacillus sedimenti]MBD0382137.1 superoxide dismutase family protein [Paenibacillus sedimenti]